MYTFHHYYVTTHLFRKSGHDTYLAYPVDKPDRRVVLKVFDTECILPETSISDFRHMETRLQGLKHPHIVAVLELGIEQGRPYIVNAYLPGGSLRQYLDQRASGHLPLEEAVGVIMQIGQATAFAHAQGILHLDIRPENVLLNTQGQALLADFSLRTILQKSKPEHTSKRQVIGYQAPEQLTGTANEATDQYALGCLLYELMTGVIPDPPLLRQHATLTTLVASTTLPTLPRQVETVLLRTLAMKPRERYPNITTFLAALKSAVQPEPPAFPFAHLTAEYKQTTPPTEPDPNEEFPPLLPNTPFIPQTLQDKNSPYTPPPPPSLNSFPTTSDWNGTSLLDRLTMADGQEDALLLSGISDIDTSPKESPPTPKVLNPKTHKTTSTTEIDFASFLDNDLPTPSLNKDPATQSLNRDIPIKSPARQDPTQALDQKDPVQSLDKDIPTQLLDHKSPTQSSNEENLLKREAEHAPVFGSTFDEQEREDDLFSSLLFDEQDEEPEAVAPPKIFKPTRTPAAAAQPTQHPTSIPQNSVGTAGSFTLPPVPDWRRSIIWLGVALTLMIMTSVLVYTFNPGMTRLMNRVSATVATPLPVATPTIQPTPTILPTAKPTAQPTKGPAHVTNPTPTPRPTPTPTPDFYTQATSGVPLNVTGQATFTCIFAGKGYQITDTAPGSFAYCLSNTLERSDFTFQANIVITGTSGDAAGIIFRHNATSEYRFRIDTSGGYDLETSTSILKSAQSSAIKTGVGQSNLLTIIAYGADIYLYVNKQRIAHIKDTTSSNGTFGLFAADFTQSTTGLFTNLQLW